jgi:CRISPR-associated protein Cmr2
LVEQLNATDNETSFIEKRLQLYRLFGNEKDGTADFLNRALAHWRVGPRPENADDQRQKEREKRVDAETKKAAQEFDALLRKRGYRQGDVEGFQGRLYFYPAYFDQIGLEVINPHPRDTGAGKQPIYFECVPAGAQGTFTLLYVPLDGAGEAADDLEAVAQGIQAMMTVYGFGAKTSSGYGTARDCLSGDGTLALRATLPGAEPSPAAAEPPQPAPDLSRYLEAPTRLHADFRRPDGSLKSEAEYQALVESRGQKYARKDRQLYAKAKAWWEREDRHLAEAPAEEPEPAVQPAPSPAPPVAEWEFTTISELQEVAQKVATLLREGGVP